VAAVVIVAVPSFELLLPSSAFARLISSLLVLVVPAPSFYDLLLPIAVHAGLVPIVASQGLLDFARFGLVIAYFDVRDDRLPTWLPQSPPSESPAVGLGLGIVDLDTVGLGTVGLGRHRNDLPFVGEIQTGRRAEMVRQGEDYPSEFLEPVSRGPEEAGEAVQVVEPSGVVQVVQV
jgi:hypothetical protein